MLLGKKCTVCDYSARTKLELGLAQLSALLVVAGRLAVIEIEKLRCIESENLIQRLMVVRGRRHGLAAEERELADLITGILAQLESQLKTVR